MCISLQVKGKVFHLHPAIKSQEQRQTSLWTLSDYFPDHPPLTAEGLPEDEGFSLGSFSIISQIVNISSLMVSVVYSLCCCCCCCCLQAFKNIKATFSVWLWPVARLQTPSLDEFRCMFSREPLTSESPGKKCRLLGPLPRHRWD